MDIQTEFDGIYIGEIDRWNCFEFLTELDSIRILKFLAEFASEKYTLGKPSIFFKIKKKFQTWVQVSIAGGGVFDMKEGQESLSYCV